MSEICAGQQFLQLACKHGCKFILLANVAMDTNVDQ